MPRKIDRHSPVPGSTCPLLVSVSPVKPNTRGPGTGVFGAWLRVWCFIPLSSLGAFLAAVLDVTLPVRLAVI